MTDQNNAAADSTATAVTGGATANADGAAPANADADAASAAAAAEAAKTGAEGGAADPKGEAPKVELSAEDKAKADAVAIEAAKVPEKYEFNLGEGVKFDDKFMEDVSATLKSAGLSQENAQKVAELGPKLTGLILEKQVAAMKQLEVDWDNATRNDKELGGEKLDENLAVAARVFKVVETPILKALLGKFDAVKNPTGTGLGNHPEIIRAFHKLGKFVSEDNHVGNSGGNGGSEPVEAKTLLYGGTK